MSAGRMPASRATDEAFSVKKPVWKRVENPSWRTTTS